MAVQWLKKGASAHKAMAEADARTEANKGAMNVRFWMKEGEERTITFLDGGLTEDGLLDIPMYYEHTVQVAGQWTQFVCIAEEEPCPLCESGDNAQLVGALSVIDHTGYFSKKQEKQIQNIRRLYIAPRTVIKKLQKLAAKRGGLAGLTFDVTRTEAKAARVGDLLDFQGKTDVKELQETFGEEAQPFNYEEVLPHASGDELRAMGFGNAKIGAEKPVAEKSSPKKATETDDDGPPWKKGKSALADQL